MRNRILVVDGDSRSLRILEVSLRGAAFDVDTASTGTEAWERVVTSPPDLVLADTQLEGIDGFELCARIRRAPGGGHLPFIFLATDQTLGQRIRGLEAGADDYLVKPAYIKEVLTRVSGRLQRRDRDRLLSAVRAASKGDQAEEGAASGSPRPDAGARFSGQLADVAVVDLLQVIEGKGRSGIIHITGELGDVGSIYFRQGQVVDAEVGPLSGIDALSRMFGWTSGTFLVEWKSIRRKDVINRPAADLILEGIERLDEWNRLKATFADSETVFEVDYLVLAEHLADIPDEVNGILRLCDGARTMRAVIEACAMPDLQALTALINLRQAGILREVARDDARQISRPRVDPAPLRGAQTQGGADADDLQRPRRRVTAPGLGSLMDSAALVAANLKPGSSPTTQHGFGPPIATDSAADNGVPEEVRDRRSSPAAGATSLDASTPASDSWTAADSYRAPPLPQRDWARAERDDSIPQPQYLDRRAGDATERVRFPDDDISDREALDELGLPSRWRSLRFMAVALLLGGGAFAVAHGFRSGLFRKPGDPGSAADAALGLTRTVGATDGGAASQPVVMPASRPPLPPGESAPEPSVDLPTQAAPIPGSAASVPGSTIPHPEVAQEITGPPVRSAPPVVAPTTAAAEPAAAVSAAAVPATPGDDAAGPRPSSGAASTRHMTDCRAAFTRSRWREAYAACTAAVTANPRSAEALTMLAHTELNRGRLARAGDLATRAIALDPDAADAYVIIGGVHQDSGENREAKVAYQRYLQLSPHGQYADELRSIVDGL